MEAPELQQDGEQPTHAGEKEEGPEWLDISSLCASASATLGVDEMLYGEDFDLFDAMSALELLDPKMDKDTPVMRSLASRFGDEGSEGTEGATLSAAGPASMVGLLGMVDAMLISEVAWMEGAALPESIYNCLYLHRESLERLYMHQMGVPLPSCAADASSSLAPVHPVGGLGLPLLALSLATLRCSNIFRNVVMFADIYEEEDCYPNTFGFKLAPPVPDAAILQFLRLSEAQLRRQGEVEAGGGDEEQELLPQERLCAHLAMRREYLEACMAIREGFARKKNGAVGMKTDDECKAIVTVGDVQDEASAGKVEKEEEEEEKEEEEEEEEEEHEKQEQKEEQQQDDEQQHEDIKAAGDQSRPADVNNRECPGAVCVRGMRRAATRLAAAVREQRKLVGFVAAAKAEASEAQELAPDAFQHEFNRHLLGSTPHRFVSFHRLGAALAKLGRVMEELRMACRIVDCRTLRETRVHLDQLCRPSFKQLLEEKGSYAGPNVFARSVATVCLYRGELILGRYQPSAFVREALLAGGVPPTFLMTPAGLEFLDVAAMPVYETLRMQCLNRARQRSKLEVLLGDYHTLQADATAVDTAFTIEAGMEPGSAPTCVSHWALGEVLSLMHRYMAVTVELELLSPCEWFSALWYWEYIFTSKLKVEQAASQLMQDLEGKKAAMEEEDEEWRGKKERRELAAALEEQARCQREREKQQQQQNKASKKGKKKGRDRAVAAAAAAAAAGAGAGTQGEKEAETDGWQIKEDARQRHIAELQQQLEGRKELRLAKVRDFRAKLSRMELDQVHTEMYRYLARGGLRFLLALHRLGVGVGGRGGLELEPVFEFTTAESIYNHRFGAFGATNLPAVLLHDSFVSIVVEAEGSGAELLKSAGDCFSAVKRLFEAARSMLEALQSEQQQEDQKEEESEETGEEEEERRLHAETTLTEEELKGVARVCVSNGVSIMRVAQALGSAESLPESFVQGSKVTLDFSAHIDFPCVLVHVKQK